MWIMKKILILTTALLIGIVGCTKKDSNSNVTTYPNVATLSVVIGSDDSMRIVVNYTANNTQTYYDDVLIVDFNDTLTNTTDIPPHAPNTSYNFTSNYKFTGSNYKVLLVREKQQVTVPGNRTDIDSASGN